MGNYNSSYTGAQIDEAVEIAGQLQESLNLLAENAQVGDMFSCQIIDGVKVWKVESENELKQRLKIGVSRDYKWLLGTLRISIDSVGGFAIEGATFILSVDDFGLIGDVQNAFFIESSGVYCASIPKITGKITGLATINTLSQSDLGSTVLVSFQESALSNTTEIRVKLINPTNQIASPNMTMEITLDIKEFQ